MISPFLEEMIILYICVEIAYTLYSVATDLIEEYYDNGDSKK